MDVKVVDPRVAEELLEAGTGERGVEVDALEERVDLDRRLRAEGSVRLARSQAVRRRRRAHALEDKFFLCLHLNS